MSRVSIVRQSRTEMLSSALTYFPCQSAKQLQYPIVLIHGWGADSQIWQDFPNQLSQYADVYTLDLPGFGGIAPLNSYSEETVIDWLHQQLPETCYLLGLSLGGMLSRAVAAQTPSRVRGVITIGANIRFVQDDQCPWGMSTSDFNDFSQIWRQSPNTCLKRFKNLQTQGDLRQRQLMAELRHLNFKIDRSGATGMLNLLVAIDGSEHIKHINCPSLALFGAEDALVPAEAAALLPQSCTTVVIPQASHLPHLSTPTVVLREIKRFLGIQESGLVKRKLAQSFSTAADAYDDVARIQSWSGQQLIERIDSTSNVDSIADLGCGTGAHCARLSALYPHASISGVDLAPGMLDYARNRYGEKVANWICCDFEHLSLQDQSQSIVFSNFALQWCDNLQQTVSEIFRVLKPGGYFYFAVPGPRTLCELRAAWLEVDGEPRVNEFLSMDLWQNSLQACGFTSVDLHNKEKIEYFSTVKGLMHSIKSVGANIKKPSIKNPSTKKTSLIEPSTKGTNLKESRALMYTRKSQFEQLYRAYDTYRTTEGDIPATWDIIYGVAKK